MASLPEKSWAAESGHPLRVAMLDEAPFSYTQEGRKEGCDPHFYRKLLAPLAGRYRFTGYPINRLMEVFARADTDLMVTSNPSFSEPPNPMFEYLGPIYELNDVIVTRDRAMTSRIEDFRALRMGQPTGVCWKLCQALANVAIVERPFRSVEQGVNLLQANRVDAIVVPETMFRMVLAAMSMQGRAPVVSFRGPSQYLFLAIHRNLPPEVREKIRNSFEKMGGSGYQRLCQEVIREKFFR